MASDAVRLYAGDLSDLQPTTASFRRTMGKSCDVEELK
jgi:hypothetical protein